MKSTPWRKPIGNCGGINTLIDKHYCILHQPDCEYWIDVITHAYREVGTSLEVAAEIHHWQYVGGKKKIICIKFETLII